MKNLVLEINRISSLMGISLTESNKMVLNEQLGWLRRILKSDWSGRPPHWRPNYDGTGKIKSFDIMSLPKNAGGGFPAGSRVISDTPMGDRKTLQELENEMDNPNGRYENLSSGAKQLYWQLYRNARPPGSPASRSDFSDALYADFLDEADSKEMDFLDAVSKSMGTVNKDGSKKSLLQALIERLGDEELAKNMLPTIEKRMKYFQAGKLKKDQIGRAHV